MKKATSGQGGFTLLEMMVVVVVIGILAAAGGVAQSTAVERSRGLEAASILQRLYSGYQRLRMDGIITSNDDGCTEDLSSWSKLDIADPNVAPTRFFNYTVMSSTSGCGHRTAWACRRGQACASRNLTIDLVTGVITRTAPY